MRVLVTGATGFLGRSLCLRLADEGTAVRALVRASAAVSAESAALERAGVELAPGDVREPGSVRDAMRGCTHVVHLAARKTAAGTPASAYHAVNVRGTANVAEAARVEGITRLVYGSALGVHGFSTGALLDESSPVRPNTPYRRTKWLGERLLREAHARHALPVVVARISTVVGAGARSWLPFARLTQEGRLRLIGDGTNRMDLVPVDDLIDGLRRCAMVPGVEGRCYVLGSGEPWTVRAFAAAVAAALGAPAPDRGPPAAPYRALLHVASFVFRTTGLHSEFAHGREVLVTDKRSSSARARAELGYAPTRTVAAAIDAMIAGFVADGRLRAPGAT
jgi:dihydroflavonol-4-reductase